MITFDSSEIANWADKPDAQHQLPELIRRLILATVPTPSLLHIPSGSSVWLRLGRLALRPSVPTFREAPATRARIIGIIAYPFTAITAKTACF